MPLYEYRCQKCGSVFEALQKFSDAPVAVHQTCGGAVDRLLSASSFHFKGTGFYATDYGKGKGSLKPSNGNGGKNNEEKHQEKAAPPVKVESKPVTASESAKN